MGDHSTLTRVGFIQVTKSKYQSHKWVMDTLVLDRTGLHSTQGTKSTYQNKLVRYRCRTPWQDWTLYTRYQKHIPDWPALWVIVRLCAYISRSPSKEAIELWWVYWYLGWSKQHDCLLVPEGVDRGYEEGPVKGYCSSPHKQLLNWNSRSYTN
jgi:hypothetical protein